MVAAAITGASVLVLSGCTHTKGVRIEGNAPVNAASPPPTAPVKPRVVTAAPGEPEPLSQGPSPSTVPEDRAAPAVSLPTAKADVVRLLKSDPAVGVKNELRACNGDGESYPLEVTFAALTGKDGSDLVVNVSTCADGLGVGSYVYRLVGGRYVNVFAAEQPQVWAQLSGRGELEVRQQNYLASDPVYDPSSETVTTYRWNGRAFEKIAVTRNDYGK